MEFLSSDIAVFLQEYGYLSVFIAMVLAGPVGAVAGGFLAGAGVFNAWMIWALSAFADIATDMFYYQVGRLGGHRVIDKLGKIFRWPNTLIQKIDWLFNKHGRKSLVLIKFTQGIGTLTQIMAGMVRMPLSVFIPYNFFSGAIYNGILVFIGVLAGTAWEVWAHRVERAGMLLGLAAVLIIIIILWGVKVQGSVVNRKLDNNDQKP